MNLSVREQIEDHLPKKHLESVAHYTRIGTLCHLLPPGSSGWTSLRATPVQFLNDRKELSLGLERLRDFAKEGQIKSLLDNLIQTFGSQSTDAFQMSFSGNADELGQWRGYAANGMGCCVVTRLAAIRAVADVAGWVIYDESQQKEYSKKILAALDSMPLADFRSRRDEIERYLVAAASFMKHEGFAPEMEFRLLKFPDPGHIRFRESGDRIVPYADLPSASPFPLEKVIIGPGWQLANLSAAELAKHHVAQGVRRLLDANGLYETGVECSRIPYDPR